MEQKRKGTSNGFSCELCKIKFSSHADFVLHEFSQKHCDNLIKLSKKKPVPHKSKKKNQKSQPKKNEVAINSVIQPGSFSKYGYFVPGEVYALPDVQREYNTEYDPYLQKFAENPFKEKKIIPVSGNQLLSECQTELALSKKKKKKSRMCQICNLVFTTVPEYDIHMKSPQHIWKLKMSGMGVSAHFVKASSDLHTTDVKDGMKPVSEISEELPEVTSVAKEYTLTEPFPLLYCSDCELLLNSPQQYNSHVVGKTHIECAQRKAELKAKKEKSLNPRPNQLYCYTCKITLNNLFQYNEHKNGKKHLSKCRQLIKKGVMIPPEERVPGLKLPRSAPNKPIIYPELYEKFVLGKGKAKEIIIDSNHSEENDQNKTVACKICNSFFLTATEYDTHFQKSHNTIVVNSSSSSDISIDVANHSVKKEDKCNLEVKECEDEKVVSEPNLQNLQNQSFENCGASDSPKEETVHNMTIISGDVFLSCRICEESFNWQSEYDAHLNSEGHFRKIIEVKRMGKNETEILSIVLQDCSCIKKNSSNKLICSFCNITTNCDDEFYQHLKSVLHKYAFKDFRRKKATEIYFITEPNEMNMYFCKVCNDSWLKLLDFVQHLNFMKHRRLHSAEKAKKLLAKKRSMLIRKRTRCYNLKKPRSCSWRLQEEKNPGIRTKVSGVAKNLATGIQECVSSLELLETKIDPLKNVAIGTQENIKTESDCTNERSMDVLSRVSIGSKVFQQKTWPKTPLYPSGPRRPNPFYSHRPLRQPFPPFSHWAPYPSPHIQRLRPCFRTPYSINHYSKPHWFQGPSYPKFLK